MSEKIMNKHSDIYRGVIYKKVSWISRKLGYDIGLSTFKNIEYLWIPTQKNEGRIAVEYAFPKHNYTLSAEYTLSHTTVACPTIIYALNVCSRWDKITSH